MSDTVRAHVHVIGRVQGVFFRHETAQRARTKRVHGWVRNRPDGRVEAVFEGPREAVESMLRFCREGPRAASVSDVEVHWEDPRGESGFAVR
ncbi:MAG: acylphosphatase [Actinomycetota bacterium]